MPLHRVDRSFLIGNHRANSGAVTLTRVFTHSSQNRYKFESFSVHDGHQETT